MDRRKWVWTLVVIFYTGFIFHNSMTPAVESSKQSGAVLDMALAMLRSLGLDWPWVTEHLIRKTAHFVEYALYGMLLWNCLRMYGLERRSWLVVQSWFGTMTPLVDETIQLFTEGRSGQISDVWLDMAGVLAGTCIVTVVYLFGKNVVQNRTEQG